jgi:hypothetical protein
MPETESCPLITKVVGSSGCCDGYDCTLIEIYFDLIRIHIWGTRILSVCPFAKLHILATRGRIY